MQPPAASVAGEKVAVAPAGRPLAAKLTLYRNVVATWGCTSIVYTTVVPGRMVVLLFPTRSRRNSSILTDTAFELLGGKMVSPP